MTQKHGEQLKREQVFCVCLICELRNCRLSLSSSHMGIKDDSGFAVSALVRQRFFSQPPPGGPAISATERGCLRFELRDV